MAFVNAALVSTSTSQDANSPRKFSYYSTDALATIIADDYFLSSYSRLKAGDVIEIRSDTANDTIWSTAIVTASSSSTVTVELKEQESCWLTAELTDVSTASSTWLAFPFDGYIRRFKTILHGAISSGNAAVGLEIGGTNVTGGQVTIAHASSAAGDVDESTCTAANTGAAGTAVEIDTDGGSTNTVSVTCMVEFVKA